MGPRKRYRSRKAVTSSDSRHHDGSKERPRNTAAASQQSRAGSSRSRPSAHSSSPRMPDHPVPGNSQAGAKHQAGKQLKQRRKRCKAGDGHHGSSSRGQNQSVPHASSPLSSEQSCDIPGFYYDAQKKKYFRILPGQNNVAASLITESVIKERQQEQIRLKKVNELSCDKQRSKISVKRTTKLNGLQPCVSNTFRSSYSCNIYDLIDSSRVGFIGNKSIQTPSHVPHRSLCHMLSHMKPRVKQKLSSRSGPGWQYASVEHCVKMYPSKDSTQMLCLWSLKETVAQMVGNINILSFKQIDEEGDMEASFDLAGPTYTHYRGQITGLSWAPVSDDQPCQQVLFTTTCFLGNSSSLAMLEPLDTYGDGVQQEPQVFDLGQGTTTWTCAWDRHAQKFSVGAEKCSLLLDVATRRVWELHTWNSDVYTQAFIPTTGQQLFSGTKKGHILCHDNRSTSTRHVFVLTHNAPLSHIQPTLDGTSVFSSDFSGQLVRWDLRQRKVVQEFVGHQNEYSRIPFHLDQSEEFLCAAGQDNYSRVWDVSTGRLLTTLPPPHPASRVTIPAVALIMGHQRAPPGLLMATHDDLHFYSQ